MVRLVLLLGLLLAVGGGPAFAGSGGEVTPDTGGETTGYPAFEQVVPKAVAKGVTIAGIHVGGMTEDEATAAVVSAFSKPLVITRKKKFVIVTPSQLGAHAQVPDAVRRSMSVGPDEAVTMVVGVEGSVVRGFVAKLDTRFSREARDSRLRFNGAVPVITKSKPGVQIHKNGMAAAIVRALKQNIREPIRLVVDAVEPSITRQTYGHVIVIQRESKKLSLYKGAKRGAKLRRVFPVATGMPFYPTPLGRFTVGIKQAHPWWYPPNSDWARGLDPVPPGPGNPLGTRWMGLSGTLVGIHGTPNAASVGYSASHGCIRMHVPSAEWLFSQISVGTQVIILPT